VEFDSVEKWAGARPSPLDTYSRRTEISVWLANCYFASHGGM
jgi:hypothetical protein